MDLPDKSHYVVGDAVASRLDSQGQHAGQTCQMEKTVVVHSGALPQGHESKVRERGQAFYHDVVACDHDQCFEVAEVGNTRVPNLYVAQGQCAQRRGVLQLDQNIQGKSTEFQLSEGREGSQVLSEGTQASSARPYRVQAGEAGDSRETFPVGNLRRGNCERCDAPKLSESRAVEAVAAAE